MGYRDAPHILTQLDCDVYDYHKEVLSRVEKAMAHDEHMHIQRSVSFQENPEMIWAIDYSRFAELRGKGAVDSAHHSGVANFKTTMFYKDVIGNGLYQTGVVYLQRAGQ